MQKSFKKTIATFLVVLMLMTSVPLNGFVGMDWSFLASAVEENIISSLEDIINEKDEENLPNFQSKFEEDKADFSEFTEIVKDEAANVFSLMAEKKIEQTQPVAKFSLRRSVAAVSEETDFSWEYDEENRTLTVRGTGDMPDYTEMMEQEGVPTPIAPWAEYAKEIEKIVIEAGITSVGDCAFALCTNLKEVVLPEGITSIGAGAFAYCVELVDINLPSTLISVDQMAFGMCWSVKELVLPDSIETIGDMAFMYMFDLEKINLPASLQDNGEGMFTYALSLKELVVPEGLKIEAVYEAAETFALSLEHVTNYSSTFTVDMSFADMLYFDSVEYADAYCRLYKNYFKYESIGEEAAMLGIEISEQELIEDTINYFNTNLGTNYAVADFENFEHVLAISEEVLVSHLIVTSGYPSYFSVSCIENSKQHELCRDNVITHNMIGEEENCVCFVMNGTIGDNITWSVDAETKTLTFDGLGEMADCDDVPGYVKYSAYIENIRFAEGSAITSIGAYAFYGLTNVETITVPEGIITLGEYCFYNSGVKTLNLPASLNSTDMLSFYTGTAPLEEINVAEGNEKFLSYEGSLYLEYVEYEGEMTYLLLKQPEKHAGKFIDNTIGIFYCAFENYSTVKEITVPDTVLVMTEGAFLACSSLKTINIGNSKIYEADGETASLEIDEDFVVECNNLTAINVDERNVNYTSVDGVLYNKAITEIITVPTGIAEVVVPETVISLPRYAFDYAKLEKITILNPECEIYDSEYTVCTGAVIYGHDKSTAQAYAEKYGRNFIATPCEAVFVEAKEATCTEKGNITYYSCSVCGLYYSDESCTTRIDEADVVIDELGHNYGEWIITTEPTCTKTGIEKRTCSRCGDDESQAVDALGHNYSEEWTTDKEATCTEDGSKSHHCTRCDDKTDITAIEAHGHDYESTITEPTCTEDGYTTHTCSICEDTYTDTVVDALGHAYSEWKVTTEPTCTKTGVEKRTCSRCGNVEEQTVDALGHDYSEEWTIDKEATCTEDGSKSHHCTRCDDKSDITVIEAHGHDYESVITEPTCTEDGYTTHTCSICEDTYTDTVVDALGHAYSEWKVTTEPTCIKTGIEKRTCSRCGNVESQTVDALGHDYSEEWTIDKEATCTEDGSKSHHCLRCDDKTDITAIEAHGHEYESVITEPTCTKVGYTTHTCSICEYTYTDTVVDALGHAYSEWKVTTEPTCTKTGVEKRTCSRCGNVESQTVDALGHNYSEEWTIDKEATCTEDGSKSHHCTRCDDKADVTVIEKLGHAYSEWVVTTEPTCTKTGIEKRTCSRCGNGESQAVDALGHNYSEEWTIDKEATCTEDGSKSHHCTRCDDKADVTVIEAVGHSYESVTTNPSCTEKGYTTHTCSVCGSGYTDSFVEATGHSNKEWSVATAPTCTKDGTEKSICETCGTTITRTAEKLGHNYGEWVIEKEATVLAEGLKARACGRCGNREEETIEKVYIDIEENTEYGLAHFTVVNAQTLEPIEGASIFVSTENDGENTFFTDAEGKISIVLPVGRQTISAYAKDCLTRNLTINVKPGENNIPQIGLSGKNTYDVELTHERMTYEEIVEAGIDVNDPDNQHMYKYELRLEFVPEIDWISFFYYMNGAGQIVGGGSGGSGGSGGGVGGWISGSGSGGGTGGYYYRPATDTEESIVVYPVSEYFYLIIRGEVKWLKEMFDVEMLVINNSMTDTLEDLTATLTLPDGLSLADMVEGEQTLTQEIGNIAEGESKSVHWYVRGDKAGSYSIEALLEGMVMPFEEEIHDVFVADKQLQVWAGDALHLHFEFPNAAYYGEDYPVTITLTNVSDITLYNVTHRITYIEQGRVTYYSDGSKEEEVYMAESDASWYKFVPEFKPGDKIVIELGINIMFESKLIEYQIEQMIKQVDAAEQFINGFKAVMAGLNAANTLVNVITGCSVAIGSFLGADDYASIAGNKANLFKALHSKISSLDKYMTSGNKTFDAAAKLANTGLSATLNAITEDPETWLRNSSYDDVKKVLKDVEALEKSLIPQATAEEVANFDIFDSIRTLITALPVKFTLVRVLYNDDYEENTTTIPWSYSVTSAGPQYFGVSNMGSYLNNLGKAVMAEIYEEAMPSYVQLIPGLDDPLNYDDVKREIIAVEHEIEQFKAKDATGKVTFNAYYVENQKSRLRTLVGNEGYTLECDNETAVFEDGVLTFTGDGTISLTPANTNGGTLYIEDSEGNTYTYDITVVEQHECKANEEQRVIISPTAEYDGFAVKCCETCEDVLEIVNLSVSNCEEHSFGAWITESEATCTVGGVATRTCSSCGYEETDFTDAIGHTEKTINKIDATCTEDGYTGDVVCEVCEETITVGEAVEANGHGYEAIITAPTCTADGYITNTCSACQDSYISDVTEKLGHTGGTANCKDKAVCSRCENAYGEINANNHKNMITDKAVSATCTSTGLTEGSHCDACGKVIVVQTTTEKLSHTEEILPVVNATCSNTGLTEGKKCSVCDEILVKQNETAKLAHSYKSVVTTPTCTAGGYTTYTCSACKDTYKANETAKLGHNMGNFTVVEQPSCTENGAEIAECSRCDYSEVKEITATGHNYQDGICTECDDSKSENCSCNCHKTGFMAFIWKILRFFYKIFGAAKVCGCGVAHY